ncbi:MAG: hypothetical protein R3B06_05025 [Kofleriaceae bacterium]
MTTSTRPVLTPLPPPAAPASDAAPTDPDDAPAPVHTERERDVLVRDAYGRDPYAAEVHGPDGEIVDTEVGTAPEDRPSPDAAALRTVRDRDDA